MLEKTPKNALRVPFIDAIWPESEFVYLYRDVRETLYSMMEAWRSGSFRTYPGLPGWPEGSWSLLLVPGWQQLKRMSASGNRGAPVGDYDGDLARRPGAAAQGAGAGDRLRQLPRFPAGRDRADRRRAWDLAGTGSWAARFRCRRRPLVSRTGRNGAARSKPFNPFCRSSRRRMPGHASSCRNGAHRSGRPPDPLSPDLGDSAGAR